MSKEPSNEHGYARMPRIIRKGYKHLTKLQKLLYIYLRDLCGEKGTCYRSLRSLANETDFSIGFLSENIPELEKSGLIEAKKKKHNDRKWEVWHITIVNIWEKNAQFIKSEKCSPDEQNSVHDMNSSQDEQNNPESVHDMNEYSEKCSHGDDNREVEGKENPLLTENVSKTNQPTTTLSSDQLFWFKSVYCQAKFVKVIPKLTAKFEEHMVALSANIETVDRLNMLFDYAVEQLKDKPDPRVRPGNLVYYLNDWLQIQPPQDQIPDEEEAFFDEDREMPVAFEQEMRRQARMMNEEAKAKQYSELLKKVYREARKSDKDFAGAMQWASDARNGSRYFSRLCDGIGISLGDLLENGIF